MSPINGASAGEPREVEGKIISPPSPVSLCVCLDTQSCPTLCDPWTLARQAPLPMEFSRQEHWSALSCPPPGDPLNPGIKPRSPALKVDSSPSLSPGVITFSQQDLREERKGDEEERP